ncbi:MAG: peroxiredoxin [Bacteriovoracia bacterium]
MSIASALAAPATGGQDPFIGKPLPNVTLPASDGKTRTLPKDILGKWTLIYFYPKDDTPGCTKQACSYRDRMDEFKRLDVNVFGVSADDLASHDQFKQKHKLNFPLLTDAKHELAGPLDVSQGGKGYFSRDTFLVNPEGKITDVWRKVNPEKTLGETLDMVKHKVETPTGAKTK